VLSNLIFFKMKKQILKFGNALSKVEQRNVHGGGGGAEECESNLDCHPAQGCCLATNSGFYGECLSPSVFVQVCHN
jgi:hypothetical protein